MERIEIRQVSGDECLEILRQLPGYAFRSSPPLLEEAASRAMLDERVGSYYLVLYEQGAPVACAARVEMTQHVRGAIFPMGGIYDVVTHPTARRKGYALRLLTQLYDRMHEEKFPLTGLYPFRESFYERLGYITFLQPKWVKLLPANLGGLLKKKLDGKVKLKLLSECFDEYHTFLQQVQQQRHGMGLFTNRPLSPGTRNDYWVAFACIDGQTRGVMLYKLRGEQEMAFDLRALRFYYLDPRARVLLLEWLARHVDQARSLEILLPPDEQPETWLSDIQANVRGDVFTGMGRVLDVAGLAGIETGEGRLTMQIHDPHCPWNEGSWDFESMDGKLQVKKSTQTGCDLSIQALSALVYGVFDPQDFEFRGWGNPDPAQQAAMRAMFPPRQPYLHELF